MKILTYRRNHEERAGLLIKGNVYDVAACSMFLEIGPLPSDLMDILTSAKLDLLRELEEAIREKGESGIDFPLHCWASLGEVRICPPVRKPSKIICLGRNYRDHIEEQGAKIPDAPLLFAKAPTAVIGHGDAILIPKGSTKVDFEGEFAFVVSKPVRNADSSSARDSILGYCCLNDVTEREIQFKEKQWFRSKSIDTFCPLGPWIVTEDDLGDPLSLAITTKVNSITMQASSTANLIFKPVDIVVFISRHITLLPGDIVSTGTPGGVGVFRDPQVFLEDGDIVEISIEGIGTLSNPVVAEA